MSIQTNPAEKGDILAVMHTNSGDITIKLLRKLQFQIEH